MKLTIIHVTDPHWICKIWRYLSVDAESEARGYDLLSSALLRLCSQDSFKSHFGGKAILAHTGDSANFYDYHSNVPIAVQFQDIKDRLIPLLESIYPNFDAKLAIPGNHDVERSIISGRITNVADKILSFEVLKGKMPNKSSLASDISVLETTAYNKLLRRYRIIDNDETSVTIEDSPYTIEVGETFDIYPDDRYKHFKSAFSEWTTPFPNATKLIPFPRWSTQVLAC